MVLSGILGLTEVMWYSTEIGQEIWQESPLLSIPIHYHTPVLRTVPIQVMSAQ